MTMSSLFQSLSDQHTSPRSDLRSPLYVGPSIDDRGGDGRASTAAAGRPVSPWPPQRAAGGDGSSLEHPAADPAPAHDGARHPLIVHAIRGSLGSGAPRPDRRRQPAPPLPENPSRRCQADGELEQGDRNGGGGGKEGAGASSVAEHPPLELPADLAARGGAHPHPLAHALRSSLLRIQLGSGSGAPRPDCRRKRAAAPLQEAEGRGIRRRRQQVGARSHGEGERQHGARKKRTCVSREIYVALKAIRPELARPELMRAYSALIRDELQFRSLMALPEEMRRDWLPLMETGNMQ